MRVLIIGTGTPVYFLCRAFLSKGHHVTLIDGDHDDCERVAGRLTATILHGDGTDPAMLEEAAAHGADALVAVTPNDQDNLAACLLARQEFGVQRTVALVNDPDNESVFGKLGVKAFSTVSLVASMIESPTHAATRPDEIVDRERPR